MGAAYLAIGLVIVLYVILRESLSFFGMNIEALQMIKLNRQGFPGLSTYFKR